MSKVRILSESLANKIAAGEVVERPASAVKELLENALDAGAHKVDIEVEAGGKRLIRVVDDGEGMSRDDAITAFERHATSKLKSAADLDSIITLGFRGEALPSIASVSRLNLRTRLADDMEGTELEFNGGKLMAVRDIAWPGGTEVEIKELFFNIPARRKFLKSEATEGYHVANLVQHYALANPDVAFMLIRDGREVLRVPAASSLKDRAYQVLGDSMIRNLVQVDYQSESIRVFGYVSNPQEQRSSRDSQYLFVNKRFVKDKLIARALSEAYRSMMPSGTYPAAILFIELPPTEVDVNVHPAKTEVRFLHETSVLGSTRTAVVEALTRTHPVTRLRVPERPAADRTDQIEAARFRDRGFPPSGAYEGEFARPDFTTPPAAMARDQHELPAETIAASSSSFQSAVEFGAAHGATTGDQNYLERDAAQSRTDRSPLQDILETQNLPEGVQSCGAAVAQAAVQPSLALESLSGPSAGMGHGIKPLGQIRDSFIVATDDEGLLLIDQHVAHERILFEQIRDHRLNLTAEVQPLLIPATLDLSPAEADAYPALQPELEAMGIETMQLSGRTIAIRTAPSGLGAGETLALVKEVIEVVERDRRSLTLETMREQLAASMACKAAIKINMPLTTEKMQWLIDELMKAQNPMTCPHGRPILMRFGLREIERGFKRPV